MTRHDFLEREKRRPIARSKRIARVLLKPVCFRAVLSFTSLAIVLSIGVGILFAMQPRSVSLRLTQLLSFVQNSRRGALRPLQSFEHTLSQRASDVVSGIDGAHNTYQQIYSGLGDEALIVRDALIDQIQQPGELPAFVQGKIDQPASQEASDLGAQRESPAASSLAHSDVAPGRTRFLFGGEVVGVANHAKPISGRILGTSIKVNSTPSPSPLDQQIRGILNRYLAQGKFKGEKGDKGDPGMGMVDNRSGQTTAVIGGTPIVTYYPPVQQTNFPGTSLAGFGQLSAAAFTTQTLTATGLATLSQVNSSSLTVSGSASINGVLSAASSTLSALTVSGDANLLGVSTLTNLTATNATTTGTQVVTGTLNVSGASVFGAGGLSVPNGRIGIGTTTSGLGDISIAQVSNGDDIIRAQRVTDTAPAGDFIHYVSASGADLFRVTSAGNIVNAGSIFSSAGLSITASSSPQLEVQYNAQNQWSISVSSAGVSTFAFNGSTPGAVFLPQVNSVNAFSFNNASNIPVLTVDTLNGGAFVSGSLSVSASATLATTTVNGTLTVNGNTYVTQGGILSVGDKIIAPGEIGLGTSTPSAKLAIQNTNPNQVAFLLVGTTSQASNLIQVTDISANALFSVAGNGNVGIGTSTPIHKFVVYGSAQVTGSLYDSTNSAGSSGYVLQSTGSGALWIATSTLVGGNALVSLNGLTSSEQSFATSTSSGLSLYITSTSSVHTFTLQPSLGYTVPLTASTTNWDNFFNAPSTQITAGTGLAWSGNTLNASNAFTSSGTNGYVARWTSPSAFSTGILLDNGTVAGVNATSSSYTLNVQGSAGVSPFNVSSSSGTSFLTVSQLGNVGIGTATPSARLAVTGSAAMDPFDISSTSGSSLVRVTQDGNVGIGVVTPAQKLEVNGIIQVDSSSGLYFFNSRNRIGLPASDKLAIYTGSSESVRIDQNGNVGIHDTVPGSKLSVVGNAQIGFSAGQTAPANGLIVSGNVGFGTTTPSARLSLTGTSALDPFDISSTSGTSLLRITQGGNVGIGTTTPAQGLHIGSASSGKNVQIANGWLCVDNNDTCTGASTAGTVYAVGTYTTGADVAENYLTSDTSLEAGDVVAADGTTPVQVVKATSMSPILGVVSTKPGVLLNGYKPLTDVTSSSSATATTVPVALSGRVPVKVSDENGPFQPGDYLVVSTIYPGYAAKAVAAGPVIGRALERFGASGSGLGKILVFIQSGYYQPTVTDLLQSTTVSQDYAWLNALGDLNITDASAFGNIAVHGSVAIQKNLHVGGVIYAVTLNVDTLVSRKLCLGDVCISKPELQQLLQLLHNEPAAPASSSGGSGSSASDGPVVGTNTPSGTSGLESGAASPDSSSTFSGAAPSPKGGDSTAP